MIRNRFFITGLVVTALIAISVIGYQITSGYVLSRTSDSTETQYLYIKPGSGLAQIAHEAKETGLVKAAWHITFGARTLGIARSLKAGEYEIEPSVSVKELLYKLQDGKTYLRRISVPEGFSILELDRLLADSFGLDTSGLILPSEGSILPETYFYSRGENANTLLARMQKKMTETVDALWEKRATNLPISNKYQAVVLASVVEKETAVAAERPLVAAVFINRLRKKMRLQSDPTIIYGITGGLPLRRPITRSDIRNKTAYNTYRVSGLPPTPIANPGRASIEAVLNPAHVNYLYFVANGTGGHSFAETLKEHNRNVKEWRQYKAQMAQKD